MQPVYIIAEAGVNHNGQEELAFKLVDVAIAAGADAVKFQTFKASKLVTKTAEKAGYQKKTTDSSESQYDMLSRLELSENTYRELKRYCSDNGIDFLSTAFDDDSLSFLHGQLGLTTLKIPSGDLTNSPLLLAHAQTGSDLIISTGMASLEEIREALGVVAYGYLNQGTSIPNTSEFERAFSSSDGSKLLKEKVTLLHCTTEYPAPPDEINLRVMDQLRDMFSLLVGYSDHSQGIAVPVAAVARGATVIEKHITLDSDMDGPDHSSSLEPAELKKMIESVRFVEKVLGGNQKAPTLSELRNRAVARKSVVAACDIAEGESYTMDNICIKRPGNGLAPIRYWDLIGTRSPISFRAGDLISE